MEENPRPTQAGKPPMPRALPNCIAKPASPAAIVMSSILKDDPETVSSLRPEVPPELSKLIRRCLQKNPSDRVQSA
jgi:serine/threonine protein kinase